MPKQVNLKVLIAEDLKRDLDALLADKKISLTDAVDSWARWLLRQDSLLQTIVLGQVSARDEREVLELVARRLGLRVENAAEPKPPAAGRMKGLDKPVEGVTSNRQGKVTKDPPRTRDVD